MGIAKTPRRKLPLSIVAVVICILIFITLFYTETIGFLSSSTIFNFKSCSRKGSTLPKSSKLKPATGDERADDEVVELEVDDRFEFDPNECTVTHGKWVFNRTSIRPLYSDRTCPYIDPQFSCVKNGRPDSDYRHWEWQPDDCVLPRFNPKVALKKLQGKRLMFVGDSLHRNQWESFVCMVESVVPEKKKSMRSGHSHSVFKVKRPYNTSIEFYWAPFLVDSNSDDPIIGDARKRVVKVDSVAKHAKFWQGVDILAFNSYVWWMSGTKIKSLWGSFANGEEGFEDLETPVAYRIGLKTWANWVDSNIDPTKTRVFFTTISPTHSRSEDWNRANGTRCYNETKPVMRRGHWGTGSDKPMMGVVADVAAEMKVPVTFINITQLSEYRKDGHSSVYGELDGKLLSYEQMADPLHYADCIHWCLPGVPDTWNQILLAYL